MREPHRKAISARKRRWIRPYAVRKPKQYQARMPGDLIELDTLDVRPLPGVVLKHFTARDVVSRWDVIEVGHRATSTAAAAFLEQIQLRMPFPIRALQVDGGSEFAAAFEGACQKKGIRLFVLPPRSPKLNGAVEPAQRTHTEEFGATPISWTGYRLGLRVPWGYAPGRGRGAEGPRGVRGSAPPPPARPEFLD